MHCEIACPCDYQGKKLISGAVSVDRMLHSTCGDRKWVCLPIVPIKIYTPRGQRKVYVLIDTGSEETLISKKLYNELNFKGIPLQVLLVTADGKRNLISSIDTSFKIAPIVNSEARFDISSTLVLDQMPSIGKNCPNASNLNLFENATDLVRNNKFPNLSDSTLNIIISVREASLIN